MLLKLNGQTTELPHDSTGGNPMPGSMARCDIGDMN